MTRPKAAVCYCLQYRCAISAMLFPLLFFSCLPRAQEKLEDHLDAAALSVSPAVTSCIAAWSGDRDTSLRAIAAANRQERDGIVAGHNGQLSLILHQGKVHIAHWFLSGMFQGKSVRLDENRKLISLMPEKTVAIGGRCGDPWVDFTGCHILMADIGLRSRRCDKSLRDKLLDVAWRLYQMVECASRPGIFGFAESLGEDECRLCRRSPLAGAAPTYCCPLCLCCYHIGCAKRALHRIDTVTLLSNVTISIIFYDVLIENLIARQ